MKAIILAAGYAVRLYPLTEHTPKALLPIGGRAMIDYLVDSIASIPEIDEAILVSNHRFAEQFTDWAEHARRTWPRLAFTVLDDGTTSNEDRLGAVGDIAFAIEKCAIREDALIAASDNFFTFDLNDYIEDFRRHHTNLLLGHRLNNLADLKRFAVAEVTEDMRISSLVEKPENPKSDIAIYALYVYPKSTLPLIQTYLDEGNNPDAPGHFPEWLYTREDVRVWLFEGECIDIGTPESYREISARYANE